MFNKAHSGPLVHFGERVLAHHQATPRAQKLHLRSQPQKHYSLWLGKCVITGMHIVAHEGQVLKTWTVTRLVKDQQFNPVEFNKIILPPHESEPHYQEPQEDRIALQELLRSFIIQQQSKMKIQDFKPSDQRFEVTVEHADSIITASPAEGANQRSSAASTATSSQPPIIPHPLVFRYLREFNVNLKYLKLNLSNQFRSEEESEQKPRPQEPSEIAAVLQDIKENHLSVGQDEVNADLQEAQSEEELLQGLIFRNGIKGIFRDIQQIRSEKLSQKSSSRLVLMVMMHMILFLLVNSVKKNVDPSLSQGGSWVLAQGANSKVDFAQKGSSKSFQGMTNMRQPLRRQPSSSFCSSDSFLGSCGVRHRISVSQYPSGSLKITNLCSGSSRTSILRTNCLASQTSTVWSQRCSKIMAGSFLTDHGPKGYDSDEVRFLRFPQERSEWSCSIGSHGLRR